MLNLYNISPVDGRYREMTEEVRNCFSEYYLIKNRVIVELEWLKKLATLKEFDIDKNDLKILDQIGEKFDLKEATRVKEIEATTKHDVKAVEYYLDEKFKEKNIDKYNHLIHFACTSEDINNLAYGIMEKQLLEEIYIPNMNKLIEAIKSKANEYYNIPMLSHTHGQSATPTTVGKEWIIYVYRLNKILDKIKTEKIAGKFNGTVGNFNAHVISYPNIDWIQVSKEFVESFGLECNLFTTQIESHDNISIIFSEIKLLNNIMLDFDNDMWMYISRNYFIQENVKGEVGSSVMPHKINPINFENSMANIKIANGILTSFIDNLQISRMQRDLSDSSILRNIGVAMAHTIIAIKQTIKGIGKVKANDEFLKEELNNTPEILAEAVQTILRKNGYKNAYEILKNMTRGRNITIQEMRDFIQKLEIDETDKNVLLNLKPQDYLGLAEELVKRNEK
ncbi:MAG: adenylosuccinate lyase [Clostridia bacterium]